MAISIIIIFLPALLRLNLQASILSAIQSGLFVIFFLWFLDLSGFTGFKKLSKTSNSGKIKAKDNIIIRPKAKPNRVKNIQKK